MEPIESRGRMKRARTEGQWGIVREKVGAPRLLLLLMYKRDMQVEVRYGRAGCTSLYAIDSLLEHADRKCRVDFMKSECRVDVE